MLIHQAKRKPLAFKHPQFNNQLLWSPGPLYGEEDTKSSAGELSHDCCNDLIQACQPIKDFLEFKILRNKMDSESSLLLPNVSEPSEQTDARNGCSHSVLNQYLVPLSLIERWGSAMGIHMIHIATIFLLLIYFC